jgi:probable rRNA maturation factor
MSSDQGEPENTSPAPLFDMLDLDSVSDEAEPDASVEIGDHVVTATDAHTGDIDLEALCRLAASVLIDEAAPAGQLDLHLVDLDTMRELNHTHMDVDEPTDVLAFPLDLDDGALSSAGERGPLLGDVVICPQVAFTQAAGHTGSFESEMALLTVHGTLHVLGHDHGETSERLRMQARERRHLAAIDVAHPVPAP